MYRRMGRTCRLACMILVGGPVASASDSLTNHHAVSLIGAPKYGPIFAHFDWIDLRSAARDCP
jgi:hypothetical protein